MESLCSTFTPFRSSAQESWSEYMMWQDAEVYTGKEKLIEKLEELCKLPSTEEEDRFIYNSGEDERYLATPVMMALLLKEYRLAEKLMDAGYFADDRLLDMQVMSDRNFSNEWNYREISVTQLLLAREDIPDSLFYKICEELSGYRPVFSFVADYWNNPFLAEDVYMEGRKRTIPALHGLERVHNSFPELLEGFIEGTMKGTFGRSRNMSDIKTVDRNLLACRLLEYVGAYEDDLLEMIEIFAFEGQEIRGKLKALRDWIKFLPRIGELCQYSETAAKQYFQYLILQHINILDERTVMFEADFKECSREMTRLIRECRPEDYDFGDYLKFVWELDVGEWQRYPTYFEMWKKYVRQPMKLERMDGAFWQILQRVIGKPGSTGDPDDDFDWMDIFREHCREDRLKTSIALMEMPLQFTTPYKKRKAERESLAVLFGAILDFGSEELAIACMKNGLIPKEVIQTLISAAISLGKIKVVPAMIAHQNMQKKEKE